MMKTKKPTIKTLQTRNVQHADLENTVGRLKTLQTRNVQHSVKSRDSDLHPVEFF